MRSSFVLAIPALALTASAEPIPRMGNAVRSSATLSSVAGQINDAIAALDDAVKPFTEDAVPVITEADNLVKVLRESRQQIEDLTAPILIEDLTNLPNLLQSLELAGESLLSDLKAKRPQVEAARICGATEIQLRTVKAAASKLVDATVAKLPEAARGLVRDTTGGLTEALERGAEAFGPANCRNKVVAPSAPPPPASAITPFPTSVPPTAAGPMPTESITSFSARPPPAARSAGADGGVLTALETVFHNLTATEDCEDASSTTAPTEATATTDYVTSTIIDTTDCEEEEPTPTTPTPTAITDVVTSTLIDTTDCEEEPTPAPTPTLTLTPTPTAPSVTTEVTTATSVDTTDCETETETETGTETTTRTTPPVIASSSTLVIVPPTTVATETTELITAPTSPPTLAPTPTTSAVGSTGVYPTPSSSLPSAPPIATGGAAVNAATGPAGVLAAGLVAALLI